MTEDGGEVENNEAAHRYETRVDGTLALLEYQRGDGRITFTHTEVPAALEGRGVGSALAKVALEDSRSQNLTVVPRCPFVAAYIRRHPEYQPLVDPSYQEQ